MNIITAEIGIDAAHRVPLHQSKCKNGHGHRYGIFAEITGNLFTEGPQTDMVLDFGFLKKLMLEHIDARCDHGIILSNTDTKFLGMAYDSLLYNSYDTWEKEIEESIKLNGFWFGTSMFGKTYIISGVPTAENLAIHWFNILEPHVLELTNNQARLSAITVKETPTSVATYRK